MARTIFLVLVLLNLLVFVWIYLKGNEHTDAGREPQRANSEQAADKVRLLTPEETAPENCRAYVGATVAEAQEIAKAWSGKLPKAHIEVKHDTPQPAFDMAIVGLASRAAAETKLAQLKRLGAADGVQIKMVDDQHFTLLMATFTERGAADEAMKEAVKKGAHSAAIIQRQVAPSQVTIEVRGSDAILKPLAELVTSHKSLAPATCEAARGSP